jgi:uncharacterized protein DUF3800
MSAHLRIADLADVLHKRGNRWKVMALLRAFFDESGTHDCARITGVCGYIGPASQWDALQCEWESELLRFSNDSGHIIDAFHAYDCENGQDFWFGLQREIREAYYQKLASVIAKYQNIVGIAFLIDKKSWDDIATPEFKEKYKSPYQMCAEMCFQQIAAYSKHRAKNTPVSLVFAEHPKYTDHVSEVFNVYMNNKLWANVNALAFSSPRQCSPLQCADMISYEAYRWWHEIGKGNFATMKDRAAWEILAQAGHFATAGCFEGLGLKNVVRAFHSSSRLRDPYPPGES